MEKQIELEVDGRTPDEVEELNLDSCKASQITGLTDKFINLQTLSMTNNELTSLKGFPALSNLRKLDLSDNQITCGLEPLAACQELEYISLSGNPIKDLTVLEPLKKLESLQTLEVFNCNISEKDGYRNKIFELLENVVYVDGFDRQGEVAPEDDEYDEGSDDEEGGSEDEDDEEDSEDGAGEEEEEDDEEGDEEESAARGTKRKHDGDDD